MENTEDLLTLVLEQHYKKTPSILDNAMAVVEGYKQKKNTREKYEKTLNILHDALKDLPQNILLYFLTTVPIPEELDEPKSSSLLDLMKETHTSLPNNIRPILLEYLNSKIPLSGSGSDSPNAGSSQKQKNDDNKENVSVSPSSPVKQDKTGKLKRKITPIKLEKRSKVKSDEYCKRLDDLCAEYVFRNINYLNSVYKGKLNKIMHLKPICRQNRQNVLKDTNRKIKLLRMIENGDVTINFLKEEFDKKDAGKTRNFNEENLILSSELKNAIDILYEKL